MNECIACDGIDILLDFKTNNNGNSRKKISTTKLGLKTTKQSTITLLYRIFLVFFIIYSWYAMMAFTIYVIFTSVRMKTIFVTIQINTRFLSLQFSRRTKQSFQLKKKSEFRLIIFSMYT